MKSLYTDTISCVCMDDDISEWFEIKSGVRQGCVIKTVTKVRLYNVDIVPVLLYGCETWTTTDTTLEKLDAFEQ